MNEPNLQSVLESLCDAESPTKADLEYLLAQNDRDAAGQLVRTADEIRSRNVGSDIVLRGIVEFSNVCENTCAYCGLNKYNVNLPRYRMTREHILESVNDIAELLDARQSTISQHLALLRKDGFVQARREGQTQFYSLKGDDARSVIETLHSLYCVANPRKK